MNDAKIGSIAWHDLTVQDAEGLRDFYAAVIGWNAQPQSMGDYDDFNMLAPGDGNCVAGVCHARAGNANLPAQWLIYVNVADLDASISACTKHGGSVVAPPRSMAGGRYCVIRDPAGAVCALWQTTTTA
jgi:hypothetical protein